MRFVLVFLFLIAAGAWLTADAQPADLMDSPECKAARAQLEAVLDDPGLGREERAQRLAAVRQQVLTICLGAPSAQPQRSGAPEPVIAVPAPIISLPPAHANVPVTSTPLPALAIPRPTVITTCDPGGCWDSAGHRLNNLGPMLVGPRGPCTLQGGIANCP
jgi:hypothetical protein